MPAPLAAAAAPTLIKGAGLSTATVGGGAGTAAAPMSHLGLGAGGGKAALGGASKAGMPAGMPSGTPSGGGGEKSDVLGKLKEKIMSPDKAARIGVLGVSALGRTIKAGILGRRAKGAMPAAVDPTELAYAQQAKRRMRAFQTGTALASERASAERAYGQGVTAAFRTGRPRAHLNALKRMFQETILGTADKAREGEKYYADIYGKAAQRIAQRKLELGMTKYSQLSAESAQAGTEAKGARNLLAAEAMPVIGGEGTASNLALLNAATSNEASKQTVTGEIEGTGTGIG